MVNDLLPSGAMVALATPVGTDGRPDRQGLARLVQHVTAGGVAGISPCGSTGEGARLTSSQRLDVTRQVLQEAPDLPVLPGITVGALPDAHRELAALADLGVKAALVAPPSYFPLTDSELETLYLGLADESPVPLVLYNIPMFTRIPLPVAVVARLAGHGNIVGLKDSSRDLEYFQNLLETVRRSEPDGTFRMYTGTDTMLVASALAGGDGTIAASANLVPRLGARILELVASDLGQAIELQQHLSRIVAACRKGSPPAGWKAALSLTGICSPALVAPASTLPLHLTERLQRDLEELGVLTRAEPAR